jgi:hypothetical protein
LGRALGMETALSDVLYFLFPSTQFFAPARGVSLMLRRGFHCLKASGVLTREFMSYTCFALITAVRKSVRENDYEPCHDASSLPCHVGNGA